jgi:rhodanese-related sulfurtransferase
MRPLLTYPAILALISLLMFSCAREKSAEIVIIDAPELENLMQNNQNLLVIDVRTADEVAMGTIPGAINIDINGPDFNNAIAAIDPSTPVVVYCASGMRSKQAAQRLAELKFTTVYDYSEGYNGWLLHQ